MLQHVHVLVPLVSFIYDTKLTNVKVCWKQIVSMYFFVCLMQFIVCFSFLLIIVNEKLVTHLLIYPFLLLLVWLPDPSFSLCMAVLSYDRSSCWFTG